MTREQAQDIADNAGLGQIHFQTNIAQNTGKPIEVGYVSKDGWRVLFCKKRSHSDETGFYLCNEFRSLDGT